MPGKKPDLLTGTGISPAPLPTPKSDPKSLYGFDETKDPTGTSNFQTRTINEHQSFYTRLLRTQPPSSDSKAIGEFDSPATTALTKHCMASHQAYGEKYQQFAKEVTDELSKLQHHKLLENIAHRKNPQDLEQFGQKIADIQDYKQKLTAIQKAEAKQLREQFTNEKGDFKEFVAKDRQVIMTADDSQKFYEKAAYQLEVTHTNQQAVLANRLNNDLNAAQKLWDNAEENMAAVTMHNLARRDKKNKAGYHTSKDQVMDGLEIHDAKEHKRIMHDSLESTGQYNLNLGRRALYQFRGKGPFNFLARAFGSAGINDNFVINFSKNDNGKIQAKCFLHSEWDSETKLSAMKAFVMECKAQGFKTFKGFDAAKLSPNDNVELVKFVREVYGNEAKIENEDGLLYSALESTRLNKMHKHAVPFLKPLVNKVITSTPDVTNLRRYATKLLDLNQRETHAEKLHNDYLAGKKTFGSRKMGYFSSRLGSNENVGQHGTTVGAIGPKGSKMSLPKPMDVPSADKIAKPSFAPKAEPDNLEGTPVLGEKPKKTPKPPGKAPAKTLSSKPVGKPAGHPAAKVAPPLDDPNKPAPAAKIRNPGGRFSN